MSYVYILTLDVKSSKAGPIDKKIVGVFNPKDDAISKAGSISAWQYGTFEEAMESDQFEDNFTDNRNDEPECGGLLLQIDSNWGETVSLYIEEHYVQGMSSKRRSLESSPNSSQDLSSKRSLESSPDSSQDATTFTVWSERERGPRKKRSSSSSTTTEEKVPPRRKVRKRNAAETAMKVIKERNKRTAVDGFRLKGSSSEESSSKSSSKSSPKSPSDDSSSAKSSSAESSSEEPTFVVWSGREIRQK